jgi:hypothetical protein
MNGGGEVEGLEDGGEQLAQLSPRKYLEKPVHELQVGRCACVGSGTSETDCFLPLFFFFLFPKQMEPIIQVKMEADFLL